MQSTMDPFMDPVGQSAVRTARRYFFEEGQPADGLISDTILRSWQRCADMGLIATRAPRIEPMSAGQLRQARERNEQLQRLCQPELQSLHGDAHDTDSVVILTDAQGLVLDSLGSPSFVTQAQRVALRPGVLWHEASSGTNAIGTALAERRAVAVRGAEHYFDPHRVLSCYAAPIFDPQGQVVGGLDLSGHANVAHTHALGMVRMAVDQIEHRFFDKIPADCEVLRVHSDSALLGTAREGVLVFRDRCLIAANRFGLGLLGLDWLVLGKQRFDELFTAHPVRLNNITHLTLLDGRKVHVRSDGNVSTACYPKVIGVPRQSTPPQNDAEPLVLDAIQNASQQQAAAMLDADIPVLLQGETGVGKEVFARAIHQLSRWHSGPFVAVNCAALPAGLIESELFGYETGAFTGARKQGSAGLLRQAQGGVLLLDEIGDMPLELQSRLLRVLQEREVSPLGGHPVALNFALICATHCDLTERVERKQFRADLYYRIAHHCVTLPALRECSNRIALISELWCQLCAGALAELPDVIVDSLNRYTWPGNYRQLLGVLRRLKVLAMSRGGAFALTLVDLPSDCLLQSDCCKTSAPAVAESSAISLAVQQEHSMRAALQASGDNVSAAARRLGISRSTLYRRILSLKQRI